VATQPYGRIHWRVPLVTECLAHGRPLLEACRLCGAARRRTARRWERFDCGHQVLRSAGDDSHPVDLEVQHVLQAALGVEHARPTEACGWVAHAALDWWGWSGDAQQTRESLRTLWADPRHSHAGWQQIAAALGARADRGLRTSPVQHAPLVVASAPAEPALSLEVLRDTIAELQRAYAARTDVADTRPT
jgi:hypothetical protein